MKKFLLIVISFYFVLYVFAFSDKDYYDFEEHGYITNPQKTDSGYVFTNNHYSKIYFFNNKRLIELTDSPGCGEYYHVQNDLIVFKYIDRNTGLQAPALYNISKRKMLLLDRLSERCGQPAFTHSGEIYYTIGKKFVFGNNSITLSDFSNITALSNDKKYLAYRDAKEQIHIYNILSGKDEIITPPKQAYYVGDFAMDGGNLIIYDVGKNIYLYNLNKKELLPLNAHGKAFWLSNSQIVFNNTIVKDFQLISSDIYLYDLKSKKITNLTNSPEIYEMNPSISNGDLIFDTYYTSSVYKANISSERLINVLQVYHTNDVLSKADYFPYKDNSTSKLNLSVPYIHQVYDNWNSYGHKYGCCAAATGLMAIMYYKPLPHWDTTCSSPSSHISHWGMYIGNVYKYRGWEYVKYSQSWSNGGIDDYDWSNGGSPSSNMRPMLEKHGLTSVQHWTSNVTYALVTGDINNNYPYPLCVTITSSGHLILAKGIYDDSKKLLYYHDPYGDKNTPGYPSYDGDDTIYDWPGENNGYENLDSIAWSVSAHDIHQVTPTVSIDDMQLAYQDFDDYQDSNVGFFLYTGGTGGMKYWRGETGGMNDNYWWTGAMYSNTTDDYHASWRPNIITAGDYEIKVYIPNATSATTNARYQIYDANGHHIVAIDQSAHTGSWVSLGTFHFNAGTSGYLYLGDGCGSKSGGRTKDDLRADKVLYDQVSFESSSGTTTIYSEDFESDDGGLVSSSSSEWQWGTDSTAGAASGTHVWGTVNGADYADHANYTLDLSVSLTSNCVLTFSHWYSIESTKATVYDGGNVKISDDGGSNFTVIEPNGSYPDTINSAYSNPLGGEPAYSGVSGGWKTATFDLSAYDGKNVIIRWNFGSDGATTDRGWYIDDVKVTSDNGSAPLPVVLSDFSATYLGESSVLYWQTQSENNISYWNIYRAPSKNYGQSQKINGIPILATGSATSQTSYKYKDFYHFQEGISYWYWLESVDYSGVGTLSYPIKLQGNNNDNQTPEIVFEKIYNYPNPFNPSTTIVYNPTNKNLKNAVLTIYNLKGQIIKNFEISGDKASLIWYGKDNQGKKVSSGVYFYNVKMKGKKTSQLQKMILIK